MTNPGNPYEETYYNSQSMADAPVVVPVVRVVKRRNTANKKERRRTLSINSAFSYLRDRIPNVPADTKLSKVSEQCMGCQDEFNQLSTSFR